MFVGQTEGETLLSLNNRRPPLDDVRVRRAISHALDRAAIIDGAMYGFGTPIGSHFPPQNPAYVDLTGRYPHDPAKARELLREAGYPNGFAVVLKLPPPSYARRSGEIVAAQLGAVGIHVSIENLEWAQWLDQVFTRHDYDMSIVSHLEPMDYDIYARDDYYFGYSNPRFKALIAALDDSLDAGRRRELLGLIQRQLAEDAVNGFLFQLPRTRRGGCRVLERAFGFAARICALDVVSTSWCASSPGGAGRGAGAAARGMRILAETGAAVRSPRLLAGHIRSRAASPARPMSCGGWPCSPRRSPPPAPWCSSSYQVVPGDPARYMMGLQAEPGAVAALRHQLGLDSPAPQRYLDWLGGLVHGDFGTATPTGCRWVH